MIPVADVARTVRRLINSRNVAVNRPAAEAGLTMLAAGGDFADGVIAYEGAWLGASSFVSFDRKAVSLLQTEKVWCVCSDSGGATGRASRVSQAKSQPSVRGHFCR